MTTKTVAVAKRLIQFDIPRRSIAEIVDRSVSYSSDLRLDRAKKVIVDVACVTLIMWNKAISIVERGQGFALWILKILHPWSHHMTRTAKAKPFRLNE